MKLRYKNEYDSRVTSIFQGSYDYDVLYGVSLTNL